MIETLAVTPALHPTKCAICGTTGNSTELYPSTVTADAFDVKHFSARRLPDRVHYRVVRCNTCGLVRSDPAADPASVAALYERSTFDYQAEVPNLRRTYGRYLKRLDRFGARHDALLEVGAGNGFFLEEALTQGYRRIAGIEPSTDAIASAPASVRDTIVNDVLRTGVVPDASFDVVCLFQVFDHLAEPAAALQVMHGILRPSGLALFLNHDAAALSARVLGERSPIIDVEHFYLYSRATLARLVEANGFEVLESGGVSNDYSISYFARLLPLPSGTKKGVARALTASRVGTLRARAALGNLFLVARRR